MPCREVEPRDSRGHRAIILTSDTLGIPQSIYRNVCAGLKEKFGLEPDQVLLTASHTHCGPVLRSSLYDACPLDDHQVSLIEKYSTELEGKIIDPTGRALADLAPPRTLPPELKTTLEMVTLNLGAAPTEAELEKMKSDPNAYVRRVAARLQRELKAGKPFIRSYPYPVQA